MMFVVLLVSGCVTETTGKREVADREKQLTALVELGTGYLRGREYGRAKEHLNKALEIDPKSSVAHNTLAIVFQLEQEYDDAERHFRLALRYDPDFTRARNNFGAYLFERERYEEAIEQLKIASEDRFYQGRPAVFENLGVAFTRMDDSAAAEQAFERSIALNPSQSRALIELAEIRFEQQRYVPARELYRRHQAFSSQSAQSLWLCVRLSRIFSDSNEQASCALALRNIFPGSKEYKEYQETMSQ
jgi:type IV pilus assembly protein PilF